MDKLKMHSPNLVDQNIDKLAELFPNCVTEAAGDDGKLRKAIDFDQLKQELSRNIVEGPQERYQLNWPGKREALLTANAPIAKTLRPCREESVNFDTTENLFIEGDNLDALKLLQETYLGKVKMIYIDPPYNTGNDFIYEDDFADDVDSYVKRTNQVDDEGNRLVANTESNGRFHSDWLSMMYSRLKLAHNLLTDDGAVFISIDDNEVHNLIKIASEIFGESNFVAQLAVQLNPRGRNLDKFIAKTHESVLVFVKDYMDEGSISGVEKEGRMVEEYNRTDSDGPFRLTGLRNRNQAFNPQTRPKLYYPLYVRPEDGRVSLSQDNEYIDEVWPDAPNGVKTCWTWGTEKVQKENELLLAEKSGMEWRIYRKDYLHGADGKVATTLVKSVWLDKEINNDVGKKSIKELFGAPLMSFPKSPGLLKKIIQIGSGENDVILDFFAGSATTAQAVMELNAFEGSKRKFVMIQLDEECDPSSAAYKAGFKKISDLSKQRIRLAGKKIEQEGVDVGFRALKVDSSNMAEVYYTPDFVSQADLFAQVDNVKEDRTEEDLLFQVMLDWGVDLTLPIRREAIDGKTVFFVADNALVACFDKNGHITESFVKKLAEFEPMRLVFRDAGFASDSTKINVEQVLKQLSPTTDVKSI
ncbi:DNA methylase N-4 [Shewanella algae]|uniref:site-specific DNA-methyltransferase n=1 Tax=Shewanella algae TaxID=38313 RepID=UPI001BEDE814|nr:site-specific DNA-methyltransferase [Shewanella algae]BCV30832.1 DNA methylase N-4 [Shewanella algae]